MLTDVTQKRRAGKQIQYQVSRMHDTKEDIITNRKKKNVKHRYHTIGVNETGL